MPARGVLPTALASIDLGAPSQITVAPWMSKKASLVVRQNRKATAQEGQLQLRHQRWRKSQETGEARIDHDIDFLRLARRALSGEE